MTTTQMNPITNTNLANQYSTVINFMGMNSFSLSPLNALKIVTTSMICGEDQYYRINNTRDRDMHYSKENLLHHVLLPALYEKNDYFTQIVYDALEFDFDGTIGFIGKLRNEYMMRLNSHYLVVAAIHHPCRPKFNVENPTKMKNAIRSACLIPTDWTTQYRLLKESKRPIPTIWKKTIAGLLENMTEYHAAKYIHGSKSGNACVSSRVKGVRVKPVKGRNGKMYYPSTKCAPIANEYVPVLQTTDITDRTDLANITDLIRITHPKSTPVITELVQTGKVKCSDSEQTWERLRSANKSWFEITEQIRMPHMALLRNLRNIIDEFGRTTSNDPTLCDVYLQRAETLAKMLISGVQHGKQFPFRYYSAYKVLVDAYPIRASNTDTENNAYIHSIPFKKLFIDVLNDCLLESINTIPEINGRVDCLTDNSGSSRQGMTSEYGTVNIYEIANLSSILTAFRSTQGGSVWIFGDRLQEYPVSRDKPILTQLTEINAIGEEIGQGTETGVWLFWENAIKTRKHLDTVFIYSDMQAGYAGLYALGECESMMRQYNAYLGTAGHIDVLQLVKLYRENVNAKTNLFSVQVAGYDNTILPDILYRGAILAGWTGKEAKMAYEMIRIWDEIEGVSV